MNAVDQALLQSASLKIRGGVPTTLTTDERQSYEFYYGTRALDEALTIKADPPPRPPKPAPGVSSATLVKVFDRYSDEVLVVLKRAIAPGAARLTALEAQLRTQGDTITALAATVEGLRAQLELRDQVKDLRAAVLDLQADRASTREPVP